MGLLDLIVFFPLTYLSPGAGLIINFLRTDWLVHHPHLSSFSLEEDPRNLCKGFFCWVRVFNHLPTRFLYFLKKGKEKWHTAYSFKPDSVRAKLQKRWGDAYSSGSCRRALVFEKQKSGVCSARSSSSLTPPLLVNFLRLKEWREWDMG